MAYGSNSIEDLKAPSDLNPHTTDGLKPQPRPMIYKTKAPTPSRSFTNISRIEKIVDPLDPLVFSNLTTTHSLLDAESEERRADADYVPNYSNRSTSDSDISVIGTSLGGYTSSGSHRLRPCTRRSVDTVQRYSDCIIRRPSQRRASIHAKARMRDQLVSDQDRQDASYNGGQLRRDTPQVSPNIPMNPDTPAGAAYWQRPFVPTNDLVLTRPATHQSDDSILNDMLRRFESSAATAATVETPRAVPQLNESEKENGVGNGQMCLAVPSRRSFLRPTERPIPLSQSAYPPPHGFKTWRKFPDTPAKPVVNQIKPAGEISPKASPGPSTAPLVPTGMLTGAGCKEAVSSADSTAANDRRDVPDATAAGVTPDHCTTTNLNPAA